MVINEDIVIAFTAGVSKETGALVASVVAVIISNVAMSAVFHEHAIGLARSNDSELKEPSESFGSERGKIVPDIVRPECLIVAAAVSG